MEPVRFPAVNATFGRGQQEYIELPAYANGEYAVSCWQLTWRERLVLFFTGRFWVRQRYFGNPLQPIGISTDSPLIVAEDAE